MLVVNFKNATCKAGAFNWAGVSAKAVVPPIDVNVLTHRDELHTALVRALIELQSGDPHADTSLADKLMQGLSALPMFDLTYCTQRNAARALQVLPRVADALQKYARSQGHQGINTVTVGPDMSGAAALGEALRGSPLWNALLRFRPPKETRSM